MLVLAAGSGERLAAGTPKAFVLLGDEPLLAWSLRAIAASSVVDGVVIVAPAELQAEAERVASGVRPGVRLGAIVAGGRTRQESVRRGLDAVAPDAAVVVCHDAARPFASVELFDRTVAALDGGRAADGAVPVVPSPDTIKRLRGPVVVETIPRERAGLAQTPQAFVAGALRNAHDRGHAAGIHATDDAMLLEAAGFRVVAVAGDPANFKITTDEDLTRARAVLAGARTPAGGSTP